MIPPGNWLGVLGGGQLGRMFVHAAQRHGYRVAVLDADTDSPGGRAADLHLCAGFDDPQALAELAARVRAITVEREDVPEAALRTLERDCVLRPSANAVLIAQDRLREKRFLESCRVPVAPFIEIAPEIAPDPVACGAVLPGLLKTARGGFDGRGQIGIDSPEQVAAAFDALQRRSCVLERKLPLAQEFSVIAARSSEGRCVSYPVFENSHGRGILDWTVFPGRIPAAAASQARDATLRILRALDYVGVLCVEFFLLSDGSVVANEMAPRPHNSGHITLDTCAISQFDLQLRTLADLPLAEPAPHACGVMANLLGEVWGDGEPAWEELLCRTDARLHLYGKAAAVSRRKMGHFTLTGPDPESLLDIALAVRARL